MFGEWRWWLGEFVLATVVGVVSGFLTKDVPISVLYALFAGTAFFILREHKRVSSHCEHNVAQWEQKALNLPITLSHLENGDPYIKQLVRSAINEGQLLARGAADGEIVLRPRSIQQIAIDFIKQAKPGDKVFATSYINPIAFWSTAEGALYRQICFDLAERGVQITRVFIEAARADQVEKECVKAEMKEQKQKGYANMELRKTTEARLPAEARKDLFLIYDRYVSYLGIGGGNTLEYLRICTRPDQLQKAKTLAQYIIGLSDEY